jgi:hypothetical protein
MLRKGNGSEVFIANAYCDESIQKADHTENYSPQTVKKMRRKVKSDNEKTKRDWKVEGPSGWAYKSRTLFEWGVR